jgi:protein-disulfide isomerase
MSPLTDKLATGLVVLCALATVALSASNRGTVGLGSKASAAAKAETLSVTQLAKLETVVLGERHDGRVHLVELVDLECPYCAKYALVLDSLKSTLGDTVSIRYVNYPIPSHRFAHSGAVALECAFRQNVGSKFVSVVYRNQDSLGFWPWIRYAQAAGVQDTAEFELCRRSSDVAERVDSALSVSRFIGARATPTVLVGNVRLAGAPRLPELLDYVRKEAQTLEPKK